MAYRYRAHFFFKENSPAGLAQWCSDQVNQRLGMAFHMNEGALNEEKTKHEVVNDLEWKADIFVPDNAQAIIDDFWAHIMTLTSNLETRVILPENEEDETEYMPSWMDVHHCYHDIGGACMPPHQTFATHIPTPVENPCETARLWDAQILNWTNPPFEITEPIKHNDAIWYCNNKTFAWIEPGTGPAEPYWIKDQDCNVTEPEEPGEPEEPEPDLCATTAAWNGNNATQYQTDFGAGLDVYVKHNNAIWKAKNATHLWIAPAHTGNGAISWQWVKDCT